MSGPPLPSVGDALTLRAVLCAVSLGSVICFVNMNLGLQTGVVETMSMQSALLGFAFFRLVQHRLSSPLSPAETTVIEVIAGALALAPFTSGLIGVIPALDLFPSSESEILKFNPLQLILWSLATCVFGIVVAVPFRHLLVLRERLCYPTAAATGILIGVLFREESVLSRAPRHDLRVSEPRHATPDDDFELVESSTGDSSRLLSSPVAEEVETDIIHTGTNQAARVLSFSFGASMLFSLVSYYIPVLRNVPVFGPTAKDWLWTLDLAPAHFGYGILIGPKINMSLVLGAVFGWGILAVMAKADGGSADAADHQWLDISRGKIIWIGMGLILGESAVVLGSFLVRVLLPWIRYHHKPLLGRQNRSLDRRKMTPSLREIQQKQQREYSHRDDTWPSTSLVTPGLLPWICAALAIGYSITFTSLGNHLLTKTADLVSLALVPLMGFISMRSLGETDDSAHVAIARLAQLIMATRISGFHDNRIPATIVFGGVVRAGASQASQHMAGLRTAHMTRTAPRAIFYSQIIGSFIGTLLATAIYRLYISWGVLSLDEFDMPGARRWLQTTELLFEQNLSAWTKKYTLGAFIIGIALGLLRMRAENGLMREIVPSGVAVAMGMYIVPAVTLPRALGSLLFLFARWHIGMKNVVLMCCATGLVLGQGTFSLVSLLIDAILKPLS